LRRTLVLKKSYELLATSHKLFLYLLAANSLKLVVNKVQIAQVSDTTGDD
jgi:hypothetical protein